MVTKALLVRLEVKPGFEDKVEEFLRDAEKLVEEEPGTVAWFVIRMGPLTYGVLERFRTMPRDAHLAGKVAEQLMARSKELFRLTRAIERLDVIASKLP